MYGKCKKIKYTLKKIYYGNIVTYLQSDFGCIERKRDHIGQAGPRPGADQLDPEGGVSFGHLDPKGRLGAQGRGSC